jgi:hypothetical protein
MPAPGQPINPRWETTGPPSGDPFAYFNMLAARPDVRASYSLRNEAQIAQYRSGATPIEAFYVYPNDPDPRKQDAMKLTLNTNSLKTQVWLPTNHQAHTHLFVTWDGWYGAEFAKPISTISGHKAWNLCSPNSAIWTEVQALFDLAVQVPNALAMTCIRQYSLPQGPNTTVGATINGRNYGSTTIGPMVGEFAIRPETWTRYWIYLEDDVTWYRLSMWMADTNQGPVQIYDRLQIKPRLPTIGMTMDGKWDILRVEYNTSQGVVAGPRPLIGYARNVVMLGGTPPAAVPALLQKPVS